VAFRVVPYNSGNPDWHQVRAQMVKGCYSAVPADVFEDGAEGFPEPA